jgi:hypothetical protein
MNQELDNYIKQARASGQTDDQIKQALVKSGWNQVQINEAFGIPNPPVVSAPVAPSAVPPPPAGAANNSMGDFLDQKTKETMIWSMIGYGARGVIVAVAGAIALRMAMPSYFSVYGTPVYYGPGFNIGSIIVTIIWSIIIGAIIGVVLAKLYSQIQQINRSFFGGWLNTLFKLLFYPVVIASLLATFLTGGFSSFFGSAFGSTFGSYLFMYFLVIIVADLVGAFVYAKIMAIKVGQYYS